ncbi:D-glycero-alpha-D-manno-heptose-1,7-bisphosphate 7-phosphatase [Desulfobaculum bizertense]|uniref:D,D-heptose 1,7-bisphosphate phosphatase n=1 Tax=Desulfobaculum bizertense DSM 18034 TaxID=1121442 RepID=A0A1T4VKS7_9BACT|nr:HAD family hydrolase [Desulfobaculum bizertense]UIJ38094.1 HAD family hydrolase [Desulfobaculum bizertense]SKA65523.1 D-glycero-D-manno-heptose 1,7-bisphosphate phosphatase [Desulfobaculum bizertense DSM 18034]
MQNIKNIILDRDGTVIIDKHYLHKPEGVELLDGAAEGLQELAKAGMNLFIATNQSGIGRGYFSAEDYSAVQKRLLEILERKGIQITGTAFCPHAPEENCSCRKPLTGMWEDLSSRFGLRPEETVMIGDKSADISFGHNAGLAASILVLTGKGTDQLADYELSTPFTAWSVPENASPAAPFAIAHDLEAAADCILHYNTIDRDTNS